jgi:hypothetical protein
MAKAMEPLRIEEDGADATGENSSMPAAPSAMVATTALAAEPVDCEETSECASRDRGCA